MNTWGVMTLRPKIGGVIKMEGSKGKNSRASRNYAKISDLIRKPLEKFQFQPKRNSTQQIDTMVRKRIRDPDPEVLPEAPAQGADNDSGSDDVGLSH